MSFSMRALTVILVGLCALGAGRKAFAHATLIRSDPADGALLDAAPGQVQLWFSEEVNPRFSMVRLLDATGQPVGMATGGAPGTERNSLRLAPPELAPGAYVALWKVLSEVDGHWSQGVVIFGVGVETSLDVGSGVAAASGLPWPEILLRWLNFALLAGLVGSLAMTWLVFAPLSARSGAEPDAAAWRTAQRWILQVAVSSAAASLVVGIGLLAWQMALMYQMAPPHTSIWEAGRLVLGQTRWGALWLVRQGLLLVIAGILFWLVGRQPGNAAGQLRWWVAFAVLALLTAQALTGHAAGDGRSPLLTVVVDVLHLLAACLWLGGLAGLLAALSAFWRHNRTSFLRVARDAGRAFSPLAALSVGVLIATGLYSMGRQVASPDALITTLYGQALAGKVGLVIIAGAFGLGNALLLHPALAQPLAHRLGRPPGWTPLPARRLPQLLVAEAVVGLAVLLATGLITATPPPRGAEFTVAAEEISTAMSQTAADLLVTLAVKPNRPGPNVFTILSASTLRPPPAIVLGVLVRFSRPEEETAPVTAIPHELEPGRYLLMGDYLTQAGPWQVEIVIQRDGLPDGVARFTWVVAPPGAARPLVLSKQPLTTPLTLAAAGALLLVALLYWWLFDTKRFSPVKMLRVKQNSQ